MKPIRINSVVQKGVTSMLVICLLLTVMSLGQSGESYDLSWRTIDGGGGQSSGGDYVLNATIGQPAAGAMNGGDYELIGGSWAGRPLCIVDFYYYARFAEHWLQTDCNDLNNWCSGADLNHVNDVDFDDLDVFVEEWLHYCPLDWQLK